jgi:calcium/calmodulin-dependent protein kinase I
MWSIGVICFEMLSGFLPFDSEYKGDIIDKIVKCEYNFNDPVWSNVSKNAKNFINLLLQKNPKKRKNCKMALTVILFFISK